MRGSIEGPTLQNIASQFLAKQSTYCLEETASLRSQQLSAKIE